MEQKTNTLDQIHKCEFEEMTSNHPLIYELNNFRYKSLFTNRHKFQFYFKADLKETQKYLIDMKIKHDDGFQIIAENYTTFLKEYVYKCKIEDDQVSTIWKWGKNGMPFRKRIIEFCELIDKKLIMFIDNIDQEVENSEKNQAKSTIRVEKDNKKSIASDSVDKNNKKDLALILYKLINDPTPEMETIKKSTLKFSKLIWLIYQSINSETTLRTYFNDFKNNERRYISKKTEEYLKSIYIDCGIKS